mmetsp:Transcript_17068/g.40485  ORF Transcript_17068/g.40485 Transcript_17068/m.40485 type:complete len:227 (+) Transcript_17068:27-707(+)
MYLYQQDVVQVCTSITRVPSLKSRTQGLQIFTGDGNSPDFALRFCLQIAGASHLRSAKSFLHIAHFLVHATHSKCRMNIARGSVLHAREIGFIVAFIPRSRSRGGSGVSQPVGIFFGFSVLVPVLFHHRSIIILLLLLFLTFIIAGTIENPLCILEFLESSDRSSGRWSIPLLIQNSLKTRLPTAGKKSVHVSLPLGSLAPCRQVCLGLVGAGNLIFLLVESRLQI